MRLVFTGVLALLLASGDPHAQQTSIAFVGCPAEGYMGPIGPPHGEAKLVATRDIPPGGLAFYKGDQAPGVFAPPGWHCQVRYGSSGGALLVTADAIPSGSKSLKVQGQAVEVEFRIGGTGGRFWVAKYASLLLPGAASAFVDSVKAEGRTISADTSDYDRRPYARDSVQRLSPLSAEFTTPGGATGVGTDEYLSPSSAPIHGIAMLDDFTPDGPTITILRIRIDPSMRSVARALMRLNQICLQRSC